MNLDSSMDNSIVIPAKAGIQLIENFPHSGTIMKFGRSSKLAASGSFCPLRGVLLSLDSRLRGNDGADNG